MKIAKHCAPGSRRYEENPYTPICDWPEDCRVQWGDCGLVLRKKGNGGDYLTAFFEAFPDTFIRGEGETVEQAEKDAYSQFVKFSVCSAHEFERWHYTNGGGVCKHCGMFKGRVFEPIPSDPNAPKGELQKMLELLMDVSKNIKI